MGSRIVGSELAVAVRGDVTHLPRQGVHDRDIGQDVPGGRVVVLQGVRQVVPRTDGHAPLFVQLTAHDGLGQPQRRRADHYLCAIAAGLDLLTFRADRVRDRSP